MYGYGMYGTCGIQEEEENNEIKRAVEYIIKDSDMQVLLDDLLITIFGMLRSMSFLTHRITCDNC